MSLEWIVTGIILLGGMTAGGISLWFKRRKGAQSFPKIKRLMNITKAIVYNEG